MSPDEYRHSDINMFGQNMTGEMSVHDFSFYLLIVRDSDAI